MSDVDYLISKARSALAKVRTVKAGDYVLSSDHNSLVDALRALEELSEALKDYADDIKAEISALRKLVSGVYEDIHSLIDITVFIPPTNTEQ